jgi:hypothetical protein
VVLVVEGSVVRVVGKGVGAGKTTTVFVGGGVTEGGGVRVGVVTRVETSPGVGTVGVGVVVTVKSLTGSGSDTV